MTARSNSWPPEKRARQAAIAKARKPWEKSTGPKTDAGKKAVSRNAYRHGFRSADYAALCALLTQQKEMARALLAFTKGKL